MKTMQSIRNELKQISYYSAHRERFDVVCISVGMIYINEILQSYNAVICRAEPRLYETYVSLYLHGNTQESAAAELNYSPNYIYKMNKKLIKFFYDEFNKRE